LDDLRPIFFLPSLSPDVPTFSTFFSDSGDLPDGSRGGVAPLDLSGGEPMTLAALRT
jgi:hypothetical protein